MRNGCIIPIVQMRKLRLGGIKDHVHPILTDHTTSGRLKFVSKSVYSESCVYCIKGKGGVVGGRGNRGGKIKEGKIAKRGKARSKEVTGFLPQQDLLMY